MTDSVVAEGHVKLRDGKKWKNRWLVLRKPSPVADCLLMLVYKDKSEKSRGNKERSSVVLEDICGLEPGLSFEGVNHILAIICLGQTVLLAFENKDTMCAWDIRTRYSLGEVHRFHVTVLPGTKLESGPATLHFCNNIFVLVRDVPPIIIGHWKLSDMRRYGAIPNGFVFEGGSRCGPWAGVFFLSCTDGERISFLFDCIVRGISPTKGPFGLRPVLPDPSISPASIEERISYEAQELEKRLSILSQSSRHSSGGDDRSLSSSTESSDTSQSDSASVGSRLTLWPEQPVAGGPPDPMLLMPPPPASRPPGLVEEMPLMETAGRGGLRGAGTGVAPHLPPPPPLAPATKPPRPRKLQEVGRQSSSDSGFATGSFSSSSCAGSLADDFGSQLSLPSLRAPRSPGLEYGRPSAPSHHHYDTPRSVLSAPGPAEQAAAPEGAGDSGGEIPADFLAAWLRLRPTGQAGEPGGGPGISVLQCESCELGTGPPFTTACQSCGGLKGTTALQLGASSIFAVPDKKTMKKDEKQKMGQMYELMESLPMEKQLEAEKGSGYEYMASCGQQKLFLETEGPPGALKSHRGQGGHLEAAGLRQKWEKGLSEDEALGSFDTKRLTGGAFAYSPDLSGPDRSHGEGATYVNIPVSPVSKKQLHYMELELQEPGAAIRAGASSSKYAQIDITATETAHKVGSQHAQHREERLQELEQKRKGPPLQ
ncbi:protein Dok-7 isoform X1 [Hemitrygon akajei]|uniref:protein Dok-7 isoform X1 n=1 Tax=Hemitrygon akajei TaxID=2704970 RepID=UPI003BF9D345